MRGLLDLATEALEFGPVSLLFGSSSGIFRSECVAVEWCVLQLTVHQTIQRTSLLRRRSRLTLPRQLVKVTAKLNGLRKNLCEL